MNLTDPSFQLQGPTMYNLSGWSEDVCEVQFTDSTEHFDPSPLVRVALTFYTSLLSISGVLGNGLVFYASFNTKHFDIDKVRSNTFLILCGAG